MRPRPAGRGFGAVVALLAAALLPGATGCDDDEPASQGAPSAAPSVGPAGLSPEMASKVIARVGDQVITLGDYATILDRMDRFERLRYQTEDRRKQLLDELIDIELLAQEAERRGLHQRPEAQELVRQVLRDELLKEVRRKLPPLDSIPMGEVRKYYEAHHDEFREPERRRLAAVVLTDAKKAAALLPKVQEADALAFGKLVREQSVERRPATEGPLPPTELAGDLGFVTAPDQGKNDNPRVPEPVRAAAFEIASPGSVLDRVVEADGRYYLVRLVTVNAARDRTLPQAERTIRVALSREKIREAEAKLEAELRKKYPVTIDQGALSRVEVPAVEGNR